ncbi:DedA family protein [Desulfosporosinus metallidurans]|uniref:Alkaline phosphatase like protein n=1 Tax=Desulfosporosinus metallidurans TaxID=1888891 RepID=A0A1Q8QZ29_9FIRM|nr:DedA family protein [Desulfosporosinus metallidurans]OLN32565.1 Alkaline phosphatase like protein [Desulfosporosinus metallidurans]
MSSTLLIHYITQYGYLGLYVILLVSILGLPLPDEFLLTFVGFMSFSGQLNPVLAIISSASGSMTGITIAYFLGRFFEAKVLAHLKKHAGTERLEKVLSWYHKHGGKLLTVGYFIPGVRHLSGYIAGLSRLSYRNFAVFSYLGAVAWTSLFIILGRTLGSRWETILPVIHRYSILLGVICVVFFLAFYLLYKHHERWGAWLTAEFLRLPSRYRSLGKLRFLITLSGVIFLGLFIFLMSLIQDFVANDVAEFDELVASGLDLASPPWVIHSMQQINALSTHVVILCVFLVALFALRRETKQWTHVLPLGLAWGGGTLVDHLFRFIFRGENVSIFENIVPFQAPNTGFLLAGLSFYAVLAYLLAREKSWLSQLGLLLGGLLLLLLLGLSPIYLQIHTPSAMVTALTVSGLWAFVCVFLYEFRLYRYKVDRSVL